MNVGQRLVSLTRELTLDPLCFVHRLLSSGAWGVLNNWLQESKDEDNFPFIVELLKVYRMLPVTVEILKTNNAAKTIKQLVKCDHEGKSCILQTLYLSGPTILWTILNFK